MKFKILRVLERLRQRSGLRSKGGIIVGVLVLMTWCLPVHAADDSFIEFPPSGTDVSSFRCPGGIVSSGDHPSDVADKCGDPVERGVLPNRKYDVWVYSSPKGKFVYYLGFLNQRLQRIYSVSCVKNDPHCQ